MLILRVGEKQASLDELVHQSIPGTILLPGEHDLAIPAVPPPLPWSCWSVYDPRLGPRWPEEECLYDGGDGGLPVGFGPDGRLHGLDPADTVAEYSTSKGQRRLAISNRVCLFAPRFAVLRTEVVPIGYNTVINLATATTTQAQFLLQERRGSLVNVQVAAPEGVQGRL